MFELEVVPTEKDCIRGILPGTDEEGVVGVRSGFDIIRLHPGSLEALQGYLRGDYGTMKIGVASSADTPLAEEIGRSALKLLEVKPGTTVWDVLMTSYGDESAIQIGRQPPLSSDKSKTHFRFIREATGVRYDEVLFFDDCIWGDHCAKVETNCMEPDSGLGPVTHRTPRGLQVSDWRMGLEKWKARQWQPRSVAAATA